MIRLFNEKYDLINIKFKSSLLTSILNYYRLLSAGLEPVLSQTEKACIASNYKHYAADKNGFNLKIFHFDIRGKLSIIRCDKYIF